MKKKHIHTSTYSQQISAAASRSRISEKWFWKFMISWSTQHLCSWSWCCFYVWRKDIPKAKRKNWVRFVWWCMRWVDKRDVYAINTYKGTDCIISFSLSFTAKESLASNSNGFIIMLLKYDLINTIDTMENLSSPNVIKNFILHPLKMCELLSANAFKSLPSSF